MFRKYVLFSLAVLLLLGLFACGGAIPVEEEEAAPPSRIMFTSTRDGNREIYVMDADGSNQQRLTDSPAIDEFGSWSPDGSRIAFESTRDGNREIYVMDADGSNQQRLTDSPAIDWFPSWSP